MLGTIPLSEGQFLKIENAAQWLCPADRDQFMAAVAAELQGCELGDGVVSRAVNLAFRQFYRPLKLPEPSGVRLRQIYKSPDRD
jgi:hypothetical protein